MGFLPSPDTDLSKLSLQELEALNALLLGELARSKARQAHIEALMKTVTSHIDKLR